MNRVDLKVVLLGSSDVGKTSLVERFVNERFIESRSYQNTIGAAFAAKEFEIDGRKLIMGIWDTAGSERYYAMAKIYYRGAKAAIVCYDSTEYLTFQKAKLWVRELRSVEEGCKIYICATKKDIIDQSNEAASQGDRETIQINGVKAYAAGIQAPLFITSSKTGENVAELFNTIAQDFLSNPENLKNLENTAVELSKQPTKRRHCCQVT